MKTIILSILTIIMIFSSCQEKEKPQRYDQKICLKLYMVGGHIIYRTVYAENISNLYIWTYNGAYLLSGITGDDIRGVVAFDQVDCK